MARGSKWINNDGLEVGFGIHTPDNELAAVSSNNMIKTVSAYITLADLELKSAITTSSLSNKAANMPRGSAILSATLQVVEAATSAAGTATFNYGTFHEDSSSVVEDDDNGIDALVAISGILDTVGAVVQMDGALVGGAIPVGATSNSAVQFVPTSSTQVFTAGKVLITIEVLVPSISGVSIDA